MKNTVHIFIILDYSFSMNSIWSDCTQKVSDFVLNFKKEFYDNGEYTIIIFNDQSKVYSKDKLSNFKGLSPDDITPEGSTALYDTIIMTCQNLDDTNEEVRKFVVVVTDGYDNKSNMGSQEIANKKISEQKEKGVEFFFFGIGIDSFSEANQIGIPFSADIDFSTEQSSSMLRQLSDDILYMTRTNTKVDKHPELKRRYTSQSIGLTRANADMGTGMLHRLPQPLSRNLTELTENMDMGTGMLDRLPQPLSRNLTELTENTDGFVEL